MQRNPTFVLDTPLHAVARTVAYPIRKTGKFQEHARDLFALARTCRIMLSASSEKKGIIMRNIERKVVEIAYDLAHDFLDAVNRSDFHFLASNFGITNDEYEEMQEEIKAYFFDCADILLSPPPRESTINGEEFFELFAAENDSHCWRIDCAIFNHGKRDEPMIHFDLFRVEEAFYLKYLYIGS
jgi:hypothetical protein